MSKYNDMRECYEETIQKLRKDTEHWHEKYLETAYKAAVADGKINMYEKLLNKFLDEGGGGSDTLFIFEGRVYHPVEHDIHMEGDRPRKLTVDFVEVPLEFRKESKV